MTTIYLKCRDCGAEGDASLPTTPGQLSCPSCSGVPSMIGVASFAEHIETGVERMAELLRNRVIGTRKQDKSRTDAEIDRDGRSAELAACVAFCPWKINDYLQMVGEPNRGNDLPMQWTGFDKPLEVKQTRHRTANTGCLLVRPPRMTPGPIKQEHIDDSYYVLLTGCNYLFCIEGWTDRDGIIATGQRNPWGVRPGQRQCIAVHWSHLKPLPIIINAKPKMEYQHVN